MFFVVVEINSMPIALRGLSRLIKLSERPTRSLKTPLKLKRVENPNPNRGSLMRAAPMIGISENKTPNKIWMMDGWKRFQGSSDTEPHSQSTWKSEMKMYEVFHNVRKTL